MRGRADVAADSSSVRRAQREAWIFFALTFVISWGLGGLYLAMRTKLEPIFGALGPHNPVFYLAAYAPTLSALILASILGGSAGVKSLFGTLIRPFRMIWLVVAAFLIPGIALVLVLLLPLFGDTQWPVTMRSIFVGLPLVLLGTWQIFQNTGPLGEELGWRGYALPRLLIRWNALTASILVGFFWTLWHVPAFFLAGVMGQSFSGFGWWALDTFAFTIVITWLFLRDNGNVLVAGIIPHFVINGMGAVGAWLSRPAETVALALVALSVVVMNWELFVSRPNYSQNGHK